MRRIARYFSRDTMTAAMGRTLATMLHNPRGRACGCTTACWRTTLGRLLSWYVPKPHHTAKPPDWKRFKQPTAT
jgi:hypothetical protein